MVYFTNIFWGHLRWYFCTKKSSNLKGKYKKSFAQNIRMKKPQKQMRKILVKLTPSLSFYQSLTNIIPNFLYSFYLLQNFWIT